VFTLIPARQPHLLVSYLVELGTFFFYSQIGSGARTILDIFLFYSSSPEMRDYDFFPFSPLLLKKKPLSVLRVFFLLNRLYVIPPFESLFLFQRTGWAEWD